MNREEIRNVLLELSGEGLLPDRGVGADDILLTHFGRLSELERKDFWPDFGAIFRDLWEQKNVVAISNAAVFVSRLSQSERPEGEAASQVAGFLLNEEKLKCASWDSLDDLRRVVAGLRLLSVLRLGDPAVWWRVCFESWLRQAKTRQGSEALYAWQAVLHASRGLLNNGEVAPNFDAWFLAAQEAKEFPSLEVFTLLTDQAERTSVDRDSLQEDVLKAHQDMHARCYGISSCPQGMQDLKAVIETWLEDRLGMKPNNAKKKLEWKKPDKNPPSARFAALGATSHRLPI